MRTIGLHAFGSVGLVLQSSAAQRLESCYSLSSKATLNPTCSTSYGGAVDQVLAVFVEGRGGQESAVTNPAKVSENNLPRVRLLISIQDVRKVLNKVKRLGDSFIPRLVVTQLPYKWLNGQLSATRIHSLQHLQHL